MSMRPLVGLLAALLITTSFESSAVAQPATETAALPYAGQAATAGFARTWARTDQPVADLQTSRTWMWGPAPASSAIWEHYFEAPNGRRLVQYYDKSRMERNDYQPQPSESDWRVTNGRLAWELITGHVQVGDADIEARQPADVEIAGDPGSAISPTYASLRLLLNEPAADEGELLSLRLRRDGSVEADPSLAAHGVTAARRVTIDQIDHAIAAPFWNFLNATGPVFEDGRFDGAALFSNAFYATGYPITEAYWANVTLKGEQRDVLLQCFERRCLTWTPGNPAGWEVETGNVGLHYFNWRYGNSPPEAAEPRDYLLIALDPGHDRTTGGALGIEYLDTMRTAIATRAALEAGGYRVMLTRASDADVLYGTAELMPPGSAELDSGYNEGYAHLSAALRRDPDIFISLHFNGAADPNVGGTAVYYSPAGGAQNEAFATLMTAELLSAIRATGYEPPNALALDDLTIGKSYGGLATLGNLAASDGNRLYGVPAVLLEPLFESNPTERAVIAGDLLHQQIAAAVVRAITSYLGVGAATFETSDATSDATARQSEMRLRSRRRSPRFVVSARARWKLAHAPAWSLVRRSSSPTAAW